MRTCYFLIVPFVLLSIISSLFGQSEKQSPPPLVVVSEITTGIMTPKTEFIGTVNYPYISDVAAEVNGKADYVNLEEGFRVKKGELLVKTNSDLLRKEIKSKKALRDQVLSDIDLALLNKQRVEKLYHEEVVSQQMYDEIIFKLINFEKKSDSIKAELESLSIELQKKNIRSPFNGVILKKYVQVGEWLTPGTVIATIAQTDVVEVVLNVPEKICLLIKQNMDAVVKINEKIFHGKIFVVIPHGDVSTRTFPVRIRITDAETLMSGMEAVVSLPSGEETKSLLVDRDAIINFFGNTVVFAVKDSQAYMTPVRVLDYSETKAGIEGVGLMEGTEVVIKGNERLRDGQRINVKREGI
ncbi:MAG: efflux RND transporter periplasmic adaptor subunit [Candidatus Kuenenia stuttgartiensis]|nr:efflux RND transporter periplasmic adaptor subunit [Candidatus Kuenenia sp.]MBE7548557.1 efflux RND transporter periplasmic adaptor subunit [Planctomycetia bacterium]MBW7942070.1 efflux RND transporter periplasmic adaptor subunit [Candidatus Kuenenia stuttgartiensis]MCZ7621999.1 efflux RND transporter periplasmic adaptor subunit [Candidatus Kuenenia sp.]